MFRLLTIAETRFKEDQHPRGQPENSGEFAPKRGPKNVPQHFPEDHYQRMPNDVYNETPKALENLVSKNGGFTYQPIRHDSPQIGDNVFSVAYSKATEQAIPKDQFNSQSLYEYMSNHWQELNQPNVYFGAWEEKGYIYLDCPTVLSDEREVIKLAQDNDQLGYFRFRDGQTVMTPKKTEATVKRIMIEATKASSRHLAEVNATLNIDDILEATESLTGRKPSPKEVMELERTMGQKARRF